MATIEDLQLPSLADMSRDQAIEYLRQLRLERRMPAKKKSKAVRSKIKQTKNASKITANDAKEILKLLGM